MVALQTPICNFGWQAPDFSLQGVDGKTYNLADIQGPKGTLIMFICNHCPFVQAIIKPLVADCQELQKQGLGIAAIMSNDTLSYPEDSFENMQIFAQDNAFSFPYLWDKTQEVAKIYDAVCTPDFFGFNNKNELHYRGRYDDSGRFPSENTKKELKIAMEQVIHSGQGPKIQTPSIGCSIKWLR